MAEAAEAESSLDVSEIENVLTEISENQDNLPLAKFVIPGNNLSINFKGECIR
jgi:hypothetical protein